MDLPKPFPILRLPFVPLQEVFKAMDPFQIINFSMISKRTKAVTKQMTFYSKYSIQLIIDEELKVSIHGSKNMTQCVYIFTSKEEKGGKVAENSRKSWNKLIVWKYSNNLIEEWKQLCKHVLEIFKKQTIDILSMTLDAFVDEKVSIINFLKTNWKSVTDCNLFQSEEENDVDEHAVYLLENIKITSNLLFLFDVKNDNFDGKIPKNLKELYLPNSHWIGYERLLEIDCKIVILEKNRISDEQWNLFIKKWIAMETHLNLVYLQIIYRNFEEFRELVLHDIPHEVVDGAVKRVLKT
ncbi:hypothetical protein CRE_31602 [Caenorhabditis remanei]|uniref:F-box domain-containing protein n=1 Tax=Caenorhabditis remanei TaxID=31234 RepID=E3NR69_CAERE|nr:hypothetical protein CRE_31602 [Caenorhabditis remanei]